MIPPIGALVRDRTNPQRGPGRIIGRDNDTAVIRFEWQGHLQRVRFTQANFVRYRLFPGTRVHANESEGEIESSTVDFWMVPPGELISYKVQVNGHEMLVPESQLIPVQSDAGDPLDLLLRYSWQGPKRFFRRWSLLEVIGTWYEETGGIPSLVGARIRPLAHQIYAIRRILWDRQPRFILGDEVGLGKTIEAGVVLHAITSELPTSTVLIIAPGAMARQWQCELYSRFGAQVYREIDAEILSKLNHSERVAYVRHPHLVISRTALRRYPEIQQELVSRGWTAVIVDEAHQFDPADPLYDFLRRLATHAYAFLELSATPSRGEAKLLTGLLALVAPSAYGPKDSDRVQANLNAQRDIWDKLSVTAQFLRAAERESKTLTTLNPNLLVEEWEELGKDDPIIRELIQRLKRADVDAAYELVSYIQEFHRFDHRIIRTRRRTVLDVGVRWSRRTYEVLRYDGGPNELQVLEHLSRLRASDFTQNQKALLSIYMRFACTSPKLLMDVLAARSEVLTSRRPRIHSQDSNDLLEPLMSDPGPADEQVLQIDVIKSAPSFPNEQKWLGTAISMVKEWQADCDAQGVPCKRLDNAAKWIEQHLNRGTSSKVLVFSQEAHIVEEFAAFLRQRRLNDAAVETFHHERKEQELIYAANKFQRDPHCRVLVSDELGGEGRNFQKATAIVHLDLPWFVGRLEQRIGRLDRIGRDPDVPAHSVVMLGPLELEQAFFRLHAETFRVFERSLGAIEFSLPRMQRRVTESAIIGSAALEDLMASLCAEIDHEIESSDQAFQFSLDASRLLLNDAGEQSAILSERSNYHRTEELFCNWARELGITVREVRGGIFEFKWRPTELRRELMDFESDSDSFWFFTGTFDRERALEDESLQYFSAGHRLIHAFVRDLRDSSEGRATAFGRSLGQQHRGKWFLVVLVRCDFNQEAAGELSPGLLTRVKKYQWPEVESAVLEIIPSEKRCVAAEDPSILQQLSSASPCQSDHKLDPQTLTDIASLPTLAGTFKTAVDLGLDIVRKRRTKLRREASEKFTSDNRLELGYYKWLARSSKDQDICDQAQQEITTRERVAQSISSEKFELEALALVVGR